MALHRALFLMFPLLLLATGARAEVEDGTAITADTLAPLAGWVEQAMHVPIKAMPITVASNVRLDIAKSLAGVQHARAAAAYLPGQILVSSTIWDPDSIRMQSYLVHELVHHAQLLSRKKYACDAAKEREAYTLQNKWLMQHGERPIVSDEWIEQISSCTGGGEGGEGDED